LEYEEIARSLGWRAILQNRSYTSFGFAVFDQQKNAFNAREVPNDFLRTPRRLEQTFPASP
jgi:hypothetical protein